MGIAWIDTTKNSIREHLSKIYKDAKAKAPPDEFKVFEAWFWRIRPHLSVDWTDNNPPETSGYQVSNPVIPIDERVSNPVIPIDERV